MSVSEQSIPSVHKSSMSGTQGSINSSGFGMSQNSMSGSPQSSMSIPSVPQSSEWHTRFYKQFRFWNVTRLNSVPVPHFQIQ